MGPLGLIMQTSNSYWWMMQVGESRMAYRRSNTLRCLARGGTGADTLWRVSQMSAEGVRIARSQSLRQKDRE
mgnify:CR=1 FL=1